MLQKKVSLFNKMSEFFSDTIWSNAKVPYMVNCGLHVVLMYTYCKYAELVFINLHCIRLCVLPSYIHLINPSLFVHLRILNLSIQCCQKTRHLIGNFSSFCQDTLLHFTAGQKYKILKWQNRIGCSRDLI